MNENIIDKVLMSKDSRCALCNEEMIETIIVMKTKKKLIRKHFCKVMNGNATLTFKTKIKKRQKK